MAVTDNAARPAFTSRFGQRMALQGVQTTAPTAETVREPSKFWLNVGYHAEGADEKFQFVSLPLGIALDAVEPFQVRGQNEEFKMFRFAQNDLLAEIRDAAAKLQPGESITLNLEVQLRRVSEDATAVAPDANPFKRKTPLIGG
jgi:hypothetical protein